MTTSTKAPRPERVVHYVLAAGFLVMLALSLPGHMTYDSLAQLREGRLGVHATWGPVVYAAILGFFDHLAPGPGLYVTASGALLYGSLKSLTDLRPQVSWWAVAAAGLLVLAPALLIYQGIVWKDVLFANLAVAAFVQQARLARDWDGAGPHPWGRLLAIMLMLALAAQVRQNGIVAGLVAAGALGWTVRARGGRAIAAWGLGGFVAVLVAGALISWLATPPKSPEAAPPKTGLRIVQTYDIVGMVKLEPTLQLKQIAAFSESSAQMVQTRGARLYSPERIDYLKVDDEFSYVLDTIPNEVISRQWFELLKSHPLTYLKVRFADFYWVFLTPKIDSCLPFAVGVDAPAGLAAEMKAPLGLDPVDQYLVNYASWLLDTPVFSHAAYFLIAVGAAGLLLWRRDPQDVPIAAMALAGIAFTGTFAIISIACDYRYLYFLDLSALAAAFYVSLDPSRSGAGQGAAE